MAPSNVPNTEEGGGTPAFNELVEKVNKGDYTKLENGNEKYFIGDKEIEIDSQEDVDFLDNLAEGDNSDKHQEARDKNAEMNKGFHPTKRLGETGKSFFSDNGNKPKATESTIEQSIINPDGTITSTEPKERARTAFDGITPMPKQTKVEKKAEPTPQKPIGNALDRAMEQTDHVVKEETKNQEGKRYAFDGVTPMPDKNKIYEPYTPSGKKVKNQQTIAMEKTNYVKESLARQDMLNRFRDQVNIGKEESVPESNPSKVANQQDQKTPTRPSLLQHFRDQTVLHEGEGIPKTEPVKTDPEEIVIEDKTQSPEEQIAETLSSLNNALERLNALKAQYPNNIEIQQQIKNLINNISINIENLTPSGSIPVVEGILEPEEDSQPPEIVPASPNEIIHIQPTPEEIQEISEREKEKKTRRAAIIAKVAGGATGFGIAVAFGSAASGPAGAALIVGAVTSTGLNLVSQRVIQKAQEEIRQTQNPERRAVLEKRLSRWNKIKTWSQHGLNFFKGFGIGLLGGSIVSRVFLQGQGLLNRIPTEINPASNLPEQNITPEGSTSVTQSRIPNATSTTTTPEIPSISPSETGLITNGRVNLPGSAWNGNLAGNPVEGANELISSSFTGGQTNMAAFHLNKDLAEVGLKLSDLTGKMGTEGVHKLLNGYFNAIRGGTANPALKTILQSSNITGASDILSMLP